MTTFLAILTGGGLAALGGLVSGLLTNWLGDKRDHRKYAHERVMALEARRQQRLEQAYVELLDHLARHDEWARAVRPFVGPVPTPEPLRPEETRRVEALVAAYGSDRVRDLLDEWWKPAVNIRQVDLLLRSLEESKSPSKQLDDEVMQEQAALPKYKEAMLQAHESIRERVRQELAGEV
jgi:hypothetical protein